MTRRPPGEPNATRRARRLLQLQAADARCCICGEPIDPGEPWDVHHVHGLQSPVVGPAHRWCNRGFENRGHPSPRSATFFH